MPLISRLGVPSYAASHARLAVVTTLTETGRSDYARRVNLYMKFAAGVRRAGVPLYTVEVVRPGTPFATDDTETSIHLIRQSQPRLWQKEHQLNCLIERLPLHYDAVAWLDADILFEHDGWGAAAELLLEQHAVVQMFDRIHWLDQDGEPLDTFRPCTDRSLDHSREIQVVGFGWCARRDVLEATGGLYAYGGAGSNDAIMARAFCPSLALSNFAAGSAKSALRWIRTAKKSGTGSFLAGHNIRHLWHGSIRSRQYEGWDRDLIDAGYDADRDPVADGFDLNTTRVDLDRILARHGCY